jgi:hypothetical protein
MTPSYTLEYALAFGLIFLGLLAVCIPRPRKAEILTPTEEAKKKKKLEKNKANAAKRKAADKKKKKATKARKAKSKAAAKK